jgi:hypothetical protein
VAGTGSAERPRRQLFLLSCLIEPAAGIALGLAHVVDDNHVVSPGVGARITASIDPVATGSIERWAQGSAGPFSRISSTASRNA